MAIVLIGVAARVVLSRVIGLGVDESYEVVMARAVQWAYLDHPPLSFWIAGAVARLAHSENRLLVRLPFIAIFAGTGWLMFRLTARLFGERAGLLAVAVLNLAPVFTLSTGSWVLPDGPLDFAMLAAALALTHVLVEPESPRSWLWWLTAGAMSGVAMLSKYHGAFLLLGALAFVVTRREARVWLRRPEPYVAAALAMAIFSPVLWWNARHGFASFRFQGGRALPAHGSALSALLQNLAGQAGYLLPWIWAPLVYVLYRALRGGPRDSARWLLACLGAGPVLVFTLVSLGGSPGLPHWPAPGYLLLIPLLGDAAAQWEARGLRERTRLRRWFMATAVIVGVLAAIAASDVATGWIAAVEPAWFRRGDPSLEAYDWNGLREALVAQGLLHDSSTVIAATHWIDAAKIGYAMGPAFTTVCLNDDPRNFAYAVPPDEFVGRDALILVRVPNGGLTWDVAARYAPYFASVKPAGRVPIMRGGRTAFDVAVFRATRMRVAYPAPSG
ncbi:MAG: glycosyltransferase family 39 protein [Gemmatimonadota bacterium]|nr:glycosyltransferase family 39 protein [Gemmatimonadota bacterium]